MFLIIIIIMLQASLLASISLLSGCEERHFRCFSRAKIGVRAKRKEGGGGGEGRKRFQSNP